MDGTAVEAGGACTNRLDTPRVITAGSPISLSFSCIVNATAAEVYNVSVVHFDVAGGAEPDIVSGGFQGRFLGP